MTIHPLLIGLLLAAAGTATAALLPAAGQLPVRAAPVAVVGLGPAALVTRGGDAGAAAGSEPGSSSGAGGQDQGRETGEVKWFNADKGFGFIIRDNGEEIFVHFRSIRGANRRGLRDGQAVRFSVADTAKGPQAEDVEPL